MDRLVARFYYVYAVDYDRGGEWSGKAFMCTRDKEFTIRGTDDCLARGYDRTGFFEVDTGEQPSWTVQLTGFDRPGAADPAAIARADGARAACRHRPRNFAAADIVPQELMRRLRRTKIVATLGPASSDRRMIASTVRGGRRRLPHQHEPHLARRACASCVAAIRAVEVQHGRPIGILVDLQGPKLRVGTFADGPVTLAKGDDLHRSIATRRRATRRACTCRIRKSSRRSSPATRCCSTTARSA